MLHGICYMGNYVFTVTQRIIIYTMCGPTMLFEIRFILFYIILYLVLLSCSYFSLLCSFSLSLSLNDVYLCILGCEFYVLSSLLTFFILIRSYYILYFAFCILDVDTNWYIQFGTILVLVMFGDEVACLISFT